MTIVKVATPLVVSDETIPKEGRLYSLWAVIIKHPKIVQENPRIYEYQLALDSDRTVRLHTTACELITSSHIWQAVIIRFAKLITDHLGPILMMEHRLDSVVLLKNIEDWELLTVRSNNNERKLKCFYTQVGSEIECQKLSGGQVFIRVDTEEIADASTTLKAFKRVVDFYSEPQFQYCRPHAPHVSFIHTWMRREKHVSLLRLKFNLDIT